MGGDDDARFLARLNVLASTWLLWIIVPDIHLWREVAGHEVGIEPTTWILTPLVVVELARLRAVVPAATRPAFTTVLALATLTGVVDLARSFTAESHVSTSTLESSVWSLVMLDLCVFCLAMARWCVGSPPRASAEAPAVAAWLAGVWRRSARWAGAGLLVAAGPTLDQAVRVLVGGRSLAAEWTVEGDDFWIWGLLGLGLIVLMLGSVFSAAASTSRTRWAIEALAIADRPQQQLTGG